MSNGLAFHHVLVLWQVFLGGEFIGGASELESIIKAGKLEQLLEERRGSPALPEDLARAVERSRAQVTVHAATLDALFSICSACMTNETSVSVLPITQHLQGTVGLPGGEHGPPSSGRLHTGRVCKFASCGRATASRAGSVRGACTDREASPRSASKETAPRGCFGWPIAVGC